MEEKPNERVGKRENGSVNADMVHEQTGRRLPPMPDYVRPLNRSQRPFSATENGVSAQSNDRRQNIKHRNEPSHAVPRHQNEPPHSPKSVRPRPSAQQSNAGGLFNFNNSSGLGFLDKLNLKNFEIDGDISLVLMMMALLGKETVDETLMLALLYIML